MKKDTKKIIEALANIGGKYKLSIICCLFNDINRFSDICKEIGITSKQLSKELKDLQKSDIITRIIHNTTPITSEYQLTKRGKALEYILNGLIIWIKK